MILQMIHFGLDRYLAEDVRKYTGENGSDDDEVDPELVQYTKPRSAKGQLGEFMHLGAVQPDDDFEQLDEALEQGSNGEWTCNSCTFANKPAFLCCEMCASHRS